MQKEFHQPITLKPVKQQQKTHKFTFIVSLVGYEVFECTQYPFWGRPRDRAYRLATRLTFVCLRRVHGLCVQFNAVIHYRDNDVPFNNISVFRERVQQRCIMGCAAALLRDSVYDVEVASIGFAANSVNPLRPRSAPSPLLVLRRAVEGSSYFARRLTATFPRSHRRIPRITLLGPFFRPEPHRRPQTINRERDVNLIKLVQWNDVTYLTWCTALVRDPPLEPVNSSLEESRMKNINIQAR